MLDMPPVPGRKPRENSPRSGLAVRLGLGHHFSNPGRLYFTTGFPHTVLCPLVFYCPEKVGTFEMKSAFCKLVNLQVIPPPIVPLISRHASYARTTADIGGLSAVPRDVLDLHEGKGRGKRCGRRRHQVGNNLVSSSDWALLHLVPSPPEFIEDRGEMRLR
jgi:hypothetical protein